LTHVLDTNVAIHVRDGDDCVDDLVDSLVGPLRLSIVTRIELEADLGRGDTDVRVRQARLDALLAALPVIPFKNEDADAYLAILGRRGFSRRKLLGSGLIAS